MKMSISQTLWNSSSHEDHKLINFNVPKYLISNFDNLVRFKRVSRTSMLVRLMEDYMRSEHQKMKDDESLNLMINDIGQRNREDLNLKNHIRKSVHSYINGLGISVGSSDTVLLKRLKSMR